MAPKPPTGSSSPKPPTSPTPKSPTSSAPKPRPNPKSAQGTSGGHPHTRNGTSNSLRIAFCLTGQLARLELVSKIKNIFIPNAKAGHLPHVFVFLDWDLYDVKQTYWNYNYSLNVFGAYNRQNIKAFIDESTDKEGVLHAVRSRVKLDWPSRGKFTPAGGHGAPGPVKDKAFTGHDGPKSNFESASSRFQNNMRWMAGLRDCVKWVMDTEQQQGWHYDLVVRLREDTYALGPWLLDSSYQHALTSSLSGTFKGINDHNFVIDRLWADTLFRGLTEDYYFNSTLEKVFWGNPEGRIRQLAEAYSIPIKGKTICQQPLIPLRGLVNESYWYLHPLFIRHFTHDCIRLDPRGNQRLGADSPDYDDRYVENPQPTCCKAEWLRDVNLKAVKALPAPAQRINGQPGVAGVPKPLNDDELYEPPQYRRRQLLRG